MSVSFQEMLDHIRAVSDSEREKGSRFERVMKKFFAEDPVYKERFSNVWLWPEWAARQRGFDAQDTGIDLVAEEREGGYCAIQCKCYAPDTRISKPHLDSFISASAREPFTARIVVDTGHPWGPTAKKTIAGLKPKCDVRYLDDLISRSFDWPDLTREEPEDLRYRPETFRLRTHQREAFNDVITGFREHDRGKLIMACGTGKTFTALRIAEAVTGVGGRVLYLVPSISLFAQSMREWATHKGIPHRYVGICSDTRAGRKDEDASLEELEIPVTTEPSKISKALRLAGGSAMTVVFCTYHSLGLVEAAQKEGAPPFDLILCDEAHRTTGIERPEDEKTSHFVLVHDGERIKAKKRLYMTATPRLYTASAREKAARHDIEVFSMDDEETYGPEFHLLPFSRAVEQDLLSDYKVVVLGVYEQQADVMLNRHPASKDSEIPIRDAAKVVGCWRALQNPENKAKGEEHIRPLKRAIAFTNTIKSSKRLEAHWDDIITQAREMLPEGERADALQCETRHVDGQHNALDRKARIDWLKGESGNVNGACRILSNARCLSEGIDVPALDAVLFMSPRNSQVDIVQAVGRAMRKAEGKEYGYIILPIAVPAGVDPTRALDQNEQFEAVWSVLRALRSHDDRLDAEINKIDLNKAQPPVIVIFNGDHGEKVDVSELPFPPVELPPGAMFAKIVEKCGDRKYWQSWAKDVADIFARLVARIGNLLESPENETLREWFGDFHEELKVSINESITRESAVDMMAQHILTRPVFEALFEDYDFAAGNPVSQALDKLREDFGEFGLENEIRDMKPFYESVRNRASGLDNSEARQRVLMELYENFFVTAMKKDADRLGIVYTPPEVVDFILHSADHVLREEFGKSLSDEGVHVLDPFTGTGIFLVRLLQSGLIHDADLLRKYREELHANEIILLAYYIAAIHIEEAFHGRLGPEGAYEPFEGVVLTDTFNLQPDRRLPGVWLPDNSARVERQQKSPIQVVVGNPPWSVGQRSAADENPNVDYPDLERRVAETYVARSKATLKNSLYDYYKMAIRWASDRIGEQGVVAFVTNGSWIDGNVDSGIRACLAEEFSAIYVLNLRGHTWKGGERGRAEGGPVFGSGSSATVAITILVRNPSAMTGDCRILYHDIGDYLKREDKLAIVHEACTVAGIEDWREITPDEHHDWIGQRDEAFQYFRPMGSKEGKAGRVDEAIFRLFSNGYKSGRDAYVYNFCREACVENALKMVGDYLGAMQKMEQSRNQPVDLDTITDDVIRSYSSNLRWDRELKRRIRQGAITEFSGGNVREVNYRPFVKQHLYADYTFSQAPGQTRNIFPNDSSENRVICVPGIGSTKPFSALVVNKMPDLHFVAFGQCFPRYRFQEQVNTQDELPGLEKKLERVDNIPDTALRVFRVHYKDNTITKDAIFDYVYGVLHAPDYRERFANDLSKELPRIPLAPDFYAFADAGRALAKFHLGYETWEEYPLEMAFAGEGEPRPEHFRIGARKMRFADKEKTTTYIVNDYVSLRGIPPEAHHYVVNGRTPLEWFIDRYYIKQDTRSGIVNDPNGWFDDPRDLITAIRRIVHVSVETARIVSDLPPAIDL